MLKAKIGEIKTADDLKVLISPEDKPKNCIVIPEKTGVAQFNVKIAAGMIPAPSNERKFKNVPTYLLRLGKDNILYALEPENKEDPTDSPKGLFNELQCEKEVNETYWIGESIIEKIKIGFLILIIIALIIVIFLIVATSTGGVVS
jgi:hypothetical protein